MKRHGSVRSQLIVLVMAIAIPLAFVVAYSAVSQVRDVERRARQTTLNLADATASNVRNFLADQEELLTGVARDRALHRMDLQGCQTAVDDLTGLFPDFANAFVAVEGIPFCSALPAPENLSADGAEWWETVRRTGRFTVGRPRVGRISNQWVVVLAVPVHDQEGRFVGALGAAVDLVRFQRLLASASLPDGAVITLQDRTGTVVARSEDSNAWVGRRLPSTGMGPEHEGRTSGTSRVKDAEGVDRLWAYVNLGEPDWRVYAGVSSDWVYGPIRAFAWRIGVAALLALLVVVTAAISIYRRIDRSLADLVRGSQAAALGSDRPIALEGPEEIVEVADQFNSMLAARSRAEAEIREAEQRFRSILEHAAFGIYLADVDGRFLEVNPALAAMLGYDGAAALKARSVQDLYEDEDAYGSVLETCTRESGVHRWDVGWIRRDGTRISVRLTGSAFPGSDGAPVFEVIAEDVTEHRALEAQLRHAQKMQAIGRLAGGVAHDFNNLLTVINGEASLVLEDVGEDCGIHESVVQILASGERAAALTRQLLAFSRQRASTPVPTDLNAVIENLERMLRRLIGENVELTLDLAPSTKSIRIDPAQLEQILMNLVLNGRDALPDGGRLTIRTRVQALEQGRNPQFPGLEAGTYAELSVADTGVGMSQEVQQRIFEPFYTTKPEGRGTGLGLSTVYGIVSQCGGRISVESAPGRGTTFTVLLPLQDGGGAERPDLSAPRRPSEETTRRRTVLVVEDERSVRDMVCRVLDRGGYRVLSAEDGEDALIRAEAFEDPIDLVLTDVRMPTMNGPEMARRMAIVRPDARVLYMSGYMDDARIPTWVRRDGGNFIAKPFSPAELLNQVAALLDAEADASRAPTSG